MRVALISHEYPVETGFGGIGTYTWYHARALARLGHTVHVLAGATAPTELRTSEHDGVVVHRFAADDGWPERLDRLDAQRLWWTKDRLKKARSAHRGFTRLLERERFDVVEVPDCGAEGALVSHLNAVPTVVRFHSPARAIMPHYDVRAEDTALCSLVERIAFDGAAGFTACAAFVAAEVERLIGVGRPIEVIPNGIDLELFDGEETGDARARHGLPPDRPVVLFCGRIEPRKGIQYCLPVVRALLERHEVAFAFAGQDLFGTMRDEILPALAGQPLRGTVHYLGALPLAEARALMRRCDVFFMPSPWEGCPYACLEAMAAGRAIVAAATSGMPELLRDGRDGLLAPLETDALVAALERVLTSGSLRAELGRAARQRVEAEFTDVAIARRTVEVYRRIADAPAPAPRIGLGRLPEIAPALQAWSALELRPAGNVASGANGATREPELARDLERAKASAALAWREVDALRRSVEWRVGELLVHHRLLGARRARRVDGWAAAWQERELARLGRESDRSGAHRMLVSLRRLPDGAPSLVEQQLRDFEAAGFALQLLVAAGGPSRASQRAPSPRARSTQLLLRDRVLGGNNLEQWRREAPERVERLFADAGRASGLDAAGLAARDGFLEGFTFARLATAWRPERIHAEAFAASTLTAFVASRLLAIPLGITCDEDALPVDDELGLVRLELEHAGLVLTSSQRARAELLAAAPELDPARLLVVPNGIDAADFPVVERREPAPGEPFRIACVGPIEATKGLLDAVAAVHLLRKRGLAVELHVVGEADGDPRSRAHRNDLCAAIGGADLWGKVHLEGPQDGDGVRRFLSIAHLFLAPSVDLPDGRRATVPTSLLEAMATGLPSVATEAGAIREFLEADVTGALVPQRAPAELAAAMERLLRDPALRTSMGRRAAAAVRARDGRDARVERLRAATIPPS